MLPGSIQMSALAAEPAKNDAPWMLHAICTRDASNIGYIYEAGRLDVSGAVGSDTFGSITIGIYNNFSQYQIDGLIYLVRVLRTHVTAEEASLLYEHARPLLTPGAPKRSGIVSVR